MSLMYTALPLSDPTRQRYQRIIDNSSRLVAKRQGASSRGTQAGNSVNTDWTTALKNLRTAGYGDYYRYPGYDSFEDRLSAQVRNGKVAETAPSKENSRKTSESLNETVDSRREQQPALLDLYNMMRGSYFGNSMGSGYYGWF